MVNIYLKKLGNWKAEKKIINKDAHEYGFDGVNRNYIESLNYSPMKVLKFDQDIICLDDEDLNLSNYNKLVRII